jgi:hypothetical protein
MIHQGLIGEMLGEPYGVAMIDELSTAKQGVESVGVAWQYCGSVGKIANGQEGVYLGYASRRTSLPKLDKVLGSPVKILFLMVGCVVIEGLRNSDKKLILQLINPLWMESRSLQLNLISPMSGTNRALLCFPSMLWGQ